MKKFIKYLVLTLLGIVVLDLANRALFTYVFNNPPENSKMKSDLSYIFNKEQSDILILGASRASHHYNPQIFIDSLGKTCFNAGQDGQPIYNQYLNLLRSLENGHVETVFLDLSPAQVTDEWIEERMEPLVPYYWKNDSVKAVVKHVSVRGSYTDLLYLSSFIQYNSQAHVLLEYLHPRYNTQKHGYVPLPYTGKEFKYRKGGGEGFKINEKAEDYLLRIDKVCKEKDIDLYIVASPSLNPFTSFVSYMRSFCKMNQIHFLDYSSKSEYIDNMLLWKDASHMNCKGADLFTEELLELLKTKSH